MTDLSSKIVQRFSENVERELLKIIGHLSNEEILKNCSRAKANDNTEFFFYKNKGILFTQLNSQGFIVKPLVDKV